MARRPRRTVPESDEKDLRWWLADEPHQAVFSLAERIDRHLRRRQADFLAYACLYDDSELATLIGGGFAFTSSVPEALTTNVVRRQVDTYVAKITKNRPVPLAMTTDGTHKQRRRAEELTEFFEGVLDSVGYYNVRPLRIRDGAIFGSGFAHNYRIGTKLVHERVFPWELAVDPREAMRGKPRSLYKTTLVDKLVLAERFPRFAEEIAKCESKSNDSRWYTASEETSDMALVREAWHLPSGATATDGAHVICVSNATLVSEEYKRSYFPFSKSDFSPPLVGWFGEGMVKGLAPVQAEINEMGMRLQEMAYMTGSYVWVPDGSGIETDTLDNGTLTLIRSAIKPDFFHPPPWHPQFFDYFQKLRTQFASEITGISGLSTRGEIPAGLEAGVAIRRYHQIESENLVPQGREDERDCVDTAWQLLDLMEEIHEESRKTGKGYRVTVERRTDGRQIAREIDYAKVRMDRESLKLRVFPTNFLATTPEDRWSQVAEMADKGLFSQDEVLTLLDFPDLKRVLNLKGTPRRIVERIVEDILDADDPQSVFAKACPEPAMNLDLCIAIGTLAYLHAKWIDGVDEANTAVLLDWVLLARDVRDNPQKYDERGSARGEVNGGAGPQPGSQDPNATVEEAVPALGDEPPLYAPPAAAPMPPNAVAPDVMAPVPQV